MGKKLKGVLIGTLLVLCVFALRPTWLAYESQESTTKKHPYQLNLGLDLQGGMHLDLAVQREAVIERTLNRIVVELEDHFITNAVDFVSVEVSDAKVVVVLGAGEQVNWQIQPYQRLLQNLDRIQQGQTVAFSLMAEEAERLRTNSVDQALVVLRNRIDSLGVAEPSLQKRGEDGLVVQLPGLKNREDALNAIGAQAVLEFYLVATDVSPQSYDPSRYVVKYREVANANGNATKEPFVLHKRAVLSGETVRDARVQFSSFDNAPYVSISFDSLGEERFASITRNNVGRNLAIVLDDKVRSAPVIREAITGGEAQISGGFNLRDATNLSIVLRSGSLPAPLNIREERTVGASLGEDSIRSSFLALVAGSVLVMLFIVAYYRTPGAFAAFAMCFNLLIILATLALVQATLTLPGVAGIVLIMGISVDANILIFERIREEIEDARSVHAAVHEGFRRAFWTIFDANLTTLMATTALLLFGAGPIKGFAVTLAIGTLASMFTAIFVTRFLFDVFLLRKANVTHLRI